MLTPRCSPEASSAARVLGEKTKGIGAAPGPGWTPGPGPRGSGGSLLRAPFCIFLTPRLWVFRKGAFEPQTQEWVFQPDFSAKTVIKWGHSKPEGVYLENPAKNTAPGPRTPNPWAKRPPIKKPQRTGAFDSAGNAGKTTRDRTSAPRRAPPPYGAPRPGHRQSAGDACPCRARGGGTTGKCRSRRASG